MGLYSGGQGLLSEGYLRLRIFLFCGGGGGALIFGGLIFGGAYYRNFTVFSWQRAAVRPGNFHSKRPFSTPYYCPELGSHEKEDEPVLLTHQNSEASNTLMYAYNPTRVLHVNIA